MRLAGGGVSGNIKGVAAPNRLRNFLKTLTVKTPLRACAREGAFMLCKIMYAMHNLQIGGGLLAVKQC